MNDQQDKIAIIGVSCLFPEARTPDEFWRNLIAGRKSVSAMSAQDIGADPAVYHDVARSQHDTSYFLQGGFVRAGDLDSLLPGYDHPFVWSLYVAQKALEDSGYAGRLDVLQQTGLIMGNLSFPTRYSHQLISPAYRRALSGALGELLGDDRFMLSEAEPKGIAQENFMTAGQPASVVAHLLRLGRTHFAIDAACASSLYAVGLACRYLEAGYADMMLAGAVNGADPLFVNMGFTHFGAYPPTVEMNRPLDSTSEGLISGEGAAMFVLKRYRDAVRDGDRVYAVIAGVGLANDGRGKHPLTPNPRGQILAFQRAYAGGIDPSDVQYVECHASGTPVGDKTEINSMAEFFAQHGSAPLIGSVKSNVGHLLTTAGSASMLKVVLSMKHGMIPGTVGVIHPMASQDGWLGAAQIVTQNTPYPATRHKRAGVNAFGFGGVSAHLILEEPQPITKGTAQVTMQQPHHRLAIVGMDAQFGDCVGIEQLANTLYDGRQHFRPLPEKRWKGIDDNPPHGAYIESFEIDYLRYKFPPKEDDQPIPQQLLLLKVADNALRDASIEEGGNVAVIIALGTDLSLHQFRGRLDLSWQIRDSLQRAGIALSPEEIKALEDIAKDAINPPAQVNQYTSYIGNIISSRVAALWNFSGPAFTLSAQENSTFKALEMAQLLLADGTVSAVVVGAVDLAGGVENVLLREQMGQISNGKPTLSFDENASGWLVGEGAGAVVLKRSEDATNDRVYAHIEAVAFATSEGQISADAVATAAQTALSRAGITPAQVGYLEACASGFLQEDRSEIAGLNRAYSGGTALSIALGSVKANIGNAFAASGIASLIKAALVLYHRQVPVVPNWSKPKYPELWNHSPFYVPTDSRSWFARQGEKRYSAISGLGADGMCAHVILREGDHETRPVYLQSKELRLFLVDADNIAGLMGRLGQMETALNDGIDLRTLAGRAFTVFRNRPLVISLVASTAEGLRKEIDAAKRGVPTAHEQGKEWQTPAGSYFTPRPLGGRGGIAFVYPGAFNAYPGLGQDWLNLFPQAHDHLLTLTSDSPSAIADRYLYQRTLAAPTRAEVRAFRGQLANDQVAMITSGTTFTILFTSVIRDIFKVRPQAAFGYSIGEGSMLWAMGVWRDGDTATQRFSHSPLFRSRVFGRKEAVRAMWGLPPHASDDFWASYVITLPYAVVNEQVARESRVYITHINTPSETVIAGDPAACERVIAALGGNAVKAPFTTVIHNEVMISEFDEFFRVHNNDLSPNQHNVTFYSAADYAPITLDQEAIARNIARVSCKMVDFPRLVNRVYDDGARIFVELGPGSTCARWVSDTLGDREHLSVSIDNLRADDHTALIKLLARLASHRVEMALSHLYGDAPGEDNRSQSLKRITLGGTPIREAILTAENRRRFSGQPAPVAMPAQASAPVERRAPAPAPADVAGEATGFGRVIQERTQTMRELAAQIAAQIHTPTRAPVVSAPPPAPQQQGRPAVPPATERFVARPAVFDYDKIDQFARGSIQACFGPEYAVYDTRRAPRIPNTDILVMTRAVEVNATRLVTQTNTSLIAEYDVPVDAWYLRENSYPYIPYSLMMEIALQPCGFLSAFMGPTFDFLDIDFYFRNLDGYGVLHNDLDARGRTITNKVVLLSSTTLQGIIIQKYSFEMSIEGTPFYSGESTFGYFTAQALESQAGLDMGKPPVKWHIANPQATLRQVAGNRQSPPPKRSFLELPEGWLAFIDDALISLDGGKNGLGYVYGRSVVSPDDWFFRCHFYQDPVMPGSLGLEAMTQAIQLYAIEAGLGAEFKAPRFSHIEGSRMVWKYRGQVLPSVPEIHVEVSITGIERVNGQIHVYADASLWKGDLRIYEFRKVGISIQESQP